MGKKKKNSIWDICVEDQMKIADKLADIEKGSCSIFDINEKDEQVDDNGFSSGLENLILRDFGNKGRKKEKYEEYNEPPVETVDKSEEYNEEELTNDSIVNEAPVEAPVEEPIEKSKPKPKHTVSRIRTAHNGIRFKAYDALNRINISDLVVQTSTSIDMALNEELDTHNLNDLLNGNYDEDYDVDEVLNDLITYIISLKHPTAVYTIQEFTSDKYKFMDVRNNPYAYDDKQFMFLCTDDYIFAYYLMDHFTEELLNYLKGYTTSDRIRILISIAYNCGTLNNAFYAEDDKYIAKYHDAIDDIVPFNIDTKQLFHDVFMDSYPKMLDEDATDDDREDLGGISMEHIEDLQTRVRNLITDLKGSDYFDCDHDVDDCDDDGLLDDEEDSDWIDDDEECDDDLLDDVEDGDNLLDDEIENSIPTTSDIIDVDSEADRALISGEDFSFEEIDSLISNEISDLLTDVTEEVPVEEEVKTSTQSSSTKVIPHNDNDEFVIPVVRKK